MNIVVIGGTRFIGAAVVRHLVDAGHSVTTYHRGEHEANLPDSVRHVRRPEAAMPVRSFPEDLLSPRPDVVIHMIAMGEADSLAALDFFRRRSGRVIWISSGDVYLAYGRFTGIEPGPIVPVPLGEDSPLRSVLYPYRDAEKPPDDLVNIYDKILVERVAMSCPELPATVLRLPKVYGPEENANLATVYSYRSHPQWRWTHGYVENVARAIVLAAVSEAAAGRVYNVGEANTPAIRERLTRLPPSSLPLNSNPKFDFTQDIAYDTMRIRDELGYRELIPEGQAMNHVLEPSR